MNLLCFCLCAHHLCVCEILCVIIYNAKQVNNVENELEETYYSIQLNLKLV